jgi:hypothetical protein
MESNAWGTALLSRPTFEKVAAVAIIEVNFRAERVGWSLLIVGS